MPHRLTSKAQNDNAVGLLPRLRGAAALSMVMGQRWLSVRLFFGGQPSRRDFRLLPRLRGAAALSRVMVILRFLAFCDAVVSGHFRNRLNTAALKVGFKCY